MANYNRTDRISEEVKRELSAVVRELKDPRIPMMTTVVTVRVTKDLKFASGFIRREIGHRLNLRNTPEFTFVADDSIEYGAHINEILREL